MVKRTEYLNNGMWEIEIIVRLLTLTIVWTEIVINGIETGPCCEFAIIRKIRKTEFKFSGIVLEVQESYIIKMIVLLTGII
jgi:hypothetical protein